MNIALIHAHMIDHRVISLIEPLSVARIWDSGFRINFGHKVNDPAKLYAFDDEETLIQHESPL